jgi:hypothetical protein
VGIPKRYAVRSCDDESIHRCTVVREADDEEGRNISASSVATLGFDDSLDHFIAHRLYYLTVSSTNGNQICALVKLNILSTKDYSFADRIKIVCDISSI